MKNEQIMHTDIDYVEWHLTPINLPLLWGIRMHNQHRPENPNKKKHFEAIAITLLKQGPISSNEQAYEVIYQTFESNAIRYKT